MILSFYLLALFLTLITELAVAWILGYRKRKYFWVILAVNFITHPLLGCFLWLNSIKTILSLNYITVVLLETVIVIIESGLMYLILREKYFDLLKLSFSINLASFLLGFLFFDYSWVHTSAF